MSSALTNAAAGPVPSERIASDRRGRQIVPATAGARHGRPRLCGDDRRSRSPKVCCRSRRAAPAFAVVDMRLGDGNGLDVISAMKKRRPEARAIILTGYGNIATAVNAVKLGAVDYLAKPVDADDVVGGFARARQQENRAAGKSDVGRSRALGAHSAHLRIMRPQRFGDRAAAQHAPPHLAAHSRQTRAEMI